jgi:hypothetical protein
MRIELTWDAEQDLADAFDWYEAQRASDLNSSTGRPSFLSGSNLPPRVVPDRKTTRGGRNIRRGIARRFPYQVLFEIKADGRSLGLAIAHTSRRPNFWRNRLP